MKKQFHKPGLAILLLSIGLNSCVVLKSVNNFSSTSLSGIKKFEEINYSFRQHCLDRCQFALIEKFEIKKEKEIKCDCDIYIKADSATMIIYNSIKGYFSGLTNLSDNKLTDYNLSALSKSLKECALGDTKIGKEQIEAFANISEILSKATTDIYRRNKIKKYIDEANGPIQILLEKFQFIIQKNLEGELNFTKYEMYDHYQNLVMNNTLTEYEKGKATMDYYQQLSDINTKQKQIDAFAKSLKSISSGHQNLYDSRNKLSAKELKELLTGYASDIQDLISEFNKLKK